MAQGNSLKGSSGSRLNNMLLEFLHTKVNSFIKWDLIRFFHDNPHTRDTSENIASYVGRDVKTTERELEGLVDVEVLKEEEVSGLKIYHLVDDEETRGLINEFMAACHDREFVSQRVRTHDSDRKRRGRIIEHAVRPVHIGCELVEIRGFDTLL